MTTTDWPEDGLEFAIWALTSDGLTAIAARVTRRRVPTHLEDLSKRVIALEKAIDAIGTNPVQWRSRIPPSTVPLLFGSVKTGKKLVKSFYALVEEDDESQRAGKTWTERNARCRDLLESLELVENDLRNSLAKTEARPDN